MEPKTKVGFEVFRFLVSPRKPGGPRAQGYLENAKALGLQDISSITCSDLYFIEGRLCEQDLNRIASELLSDSITQTVAWRKAGSTPPLAERTTSAVVEISLRPGVTDPVAEEIIRASKELGIAGVKRASSGLRFEVGGQNISRATIELLTKRLLANPVIHQFAFGEISPSFPEDVRASQQVETVNIRGLGAKALLALSQERRAALDVEEMLAIQKYFERQGRDPSDAEFETIAQTWSEHCVHKTFKARVTLERSHGTTEEIDGILKTYIRGATEKIAAPWVRSAFVDNAGIIDFDEEYEVSFKVETHNHPSAIEPFGGANTGVGGVIRDVLGVSAKPIAATDVLCFGPQELDIRSLPEGVLHPRRIQAGVVAGIEDYGNKIGLPTVNGAVFYDQGYTANPLVLCGCVGLAPKKSHPRSPQPGDRVIVLGGRTGRDGLRGATFSSMTMDAGTGEVAGASVQIGDPITEKGLVEVVVRARDQKLYHAITDCGAGGLSSAVGEMASETGAVVDLEAVPLKYPGLAPWEIWLSEAQERMVLAVPPESLGALASLCNIFNVELSDIGEFNASGKLVVRFAGREVLNLENTFLHQGIPRRHLQAELPEKTSEATVKNDWTIDSSRFGHILLDLLRHPNIASKEAIIRVYDHEVQGGTAVKPLTGVMNDGPSDAAVIKPMGTKGMTGIVLSNGASPEYGKFDPYHMAVAALDEAVRNAVAVGADPARIAVLDNFCWGDPLRKETLGALVEAARGCHDAALHYGTPFISGKDSLNNEYLGADGRRHAIPHTLLISAIGIIHDATKAVTSDLKEPGSLLYLVGQHQKAFGGSHFSLVAGGAFSGQVPGISHQAPGVYRALQRAIEKSLVRSCHDLSEGGLAVTVAEMCIGGRLGARLSLEDSEVLALLFGETNGCLVCEVREQDGPQFESLFAGLPIQQIGAVQPETLVVQSAKNEELFSLDVTALVAAWTRQASRAAAGGSL